MTGDTLKLVIGVPKETVENEIRTALVPGSISAYKKAGFQVVIEAGVGNAAGFPDLLYTAKGAVIKNRKETFKSADIILQVRGYSTNPESGKSDFKLFKDGQIIVGFFNPLGSPQLVKELASTGVTSFAIELLPRITRAQSMDALSSMATVAGYKAALIAAETLPKMFPMMMTAAGTITPARVFVIGAGVAGLLAIATARRLGAVVKSYDIRPDVKEQVESLGAKFIELDLQTGETEDKGGYAKAMDENFYRRQREMMTTVLKEVDVVITTAAVPGKKAPILIDEKMVDVMPPGSVIVDLAAEQGGNCSLTNPGKSVRHNDVVVLGPENLPSTVPYHASQMYSKNLLSFIQNMVKNGKLELNMEDEIIKETMLTHNGEVVNDKILDLLKSDDSGRKQRS